MNFSTYAIDDLTAFSTRWCANKFPLRQDQLGIDAILNWLRTSTKFLLPADGDVGVKVSTLAAMQFVRCPFPITAFEFSMNERTDLDPGGRYASMGAPIDASLKRIALVMELDTFLKSMPDSVAELLTYKIIGIEEVKQNNSLVVTTVSHMERFGTWMPCPVALIISRESGIHESADISLGIKFLGTAVPIMPGLIDYLAAHEGQTTKTMIDTQVMDTSYEVSVALNALACLNAKNVKSLCIEAPAALNKKRAKTGKTPFFEYKVLDIFLGDNVRQANSGSGKRLRASVASWVKTSKKLHAVRGHFKVRRTGIFWWSNFYRGIKSQGEVTKDYDIKIRSEK